MPTIDEKCPKCGQDLCVEVTASLEKGIYATVFCIFCDYEREEN